MIDSHCHLADETFASDLEPVVVRAKEAGLEGGLVILEAGNAAEAAQWIHVADLWGEARAAVGVHPHIAGRYGDDPDRAAAVVEAQIAETGGARAVGEIGLDYHYDHAPRPVQQQVLRAQLRLARTLQLPVVIHTREADADTITILREERASDVGGVLHCFTGTGELARAGLDLGFFISVAGIITFPKSEALRGTIKSVPLDRLLVETDSPFLSPVPHRGKRNEPAHVVQVVKALAAILGIEPPAASRATSENFRRLFRP